MSARASLADAIARAPRGAKANGGGRVAEMFERAEGACEESRCREVRRRALKLLVAEHQRNGDLESAARSALRSMALHADSLPPAERPYAWNDEAARACAAYDAKAGAGACRRLERALIGRHAFRDFSRESSPGEGLEPALVRKVGAHYEVTIQDCLSDEARRLQAPSQERYTVRWTVRNDGRVVEMTLGRRHLEGGPLARCLRERLALWRYPRYEGELQHVEQNFVVVAR